MGVDVPQGAAPAPARWSSGPSPRPGDRGLPGRLCSPEVHAPASRAGASRPCPVPASVVLGNDRAVFVSAFVLHFFVGSGAIFSFGFRLRLQSRRRVLFSFGEPCFWPFSFSRSSCLKTVRQ